MRDATAGIAGDTATAAFIVDQTTDDLLRIAIAALVANLLMLVIFLRALVAALYLLVGTMLSLGAALGLTMLLFGHLNPGAGLTFYVPLAGAVLLLAFGSDYNIFAVGNIWEAARSRPLLMAVEETMPGAVGAILTAGLALAASFGLLSVVPLVPFRELAFFMSIGITLDVLVVRSLLMPALLTLFGRVSAWPSRRFKVGPD
jgi:RND superfamily putative drug exporter